MRCHAASAGVHSNGRESGGGSERAAAAAAVHPPKALAHLSEHWAPRLNNFSCQRPGEAVCELKGSRPFASGRSRCPGRGQY